MPSCNRFSITSRSPHYSRATKQDTNFHLGSSGCTLLSDVDRKYDMHASPSNVCFCHQSSFLYPPDKSYGNPPVAGPPAAALPHECYYRTIYKVYLNSGLSLSVLSTSTCELSPISPTTRFDSSSAKGVASGAEVEARASLRAFSRLNMNRRAKDAKIVNTIPTITVIHVDLYLILASWANTKLESALAWSLHHVILTMPRQCYPRCSR